jgi:hypothetical protein
MRENPPLSHETAVGAASRALTRRVDIIKAEGSLYGRRPTFKELTGLRMR